MTDQNWNIELTSASRYNGGVAIKRLYGSSTITNFYVRVNGSLWDGTIPGRGATPGERKTYAKNKVLELLNKGLDKKILID